MTEFEDIKIVDIDDERSTISIQDVGTACYLLSANPPSLWIQIFQERHSRLPFGPESSLGTKKWRRAEISGTYLTVDVWPGGLPKLKERLDKRVADTNEAFRKMVN